MGTTPGNAGDVSVYKETSTRMSPNGTLLLGIRLPLAVWLPVRDNGIEILALLCGAAFWEAAGWLLQLPWLPPFSKVVQALVDFVHSGVIIANIGVSLRGLLIGFSFSLVFGLLIGGLMGRYRAVDKALDIYVYALFTCPPIIFAPIFFAMFGLSDVARIAIIIIYALFVIVINTSTAIRTVDPALVEMARSFGCGERQIFLRILLPASLPLVFAGIRLGMGRAVKGMINGEMLIAFVGLGALAQRYGSQFEADKVFAIAMVVLIIGLVANWIIQTVDRRLTRWAD